MKRNRRTIVVTLLIAGLLFAGGVIANHFIKQRLQKKLITDYAKQEVLIGQEVSSTLTDRVQTIENTLSAVALDKDIQSPDPKVCQPAIERAFKNLSINVGNIGRVNSQGVFYCTVNKALIGVPASKLGTYVKQLFDDPKHNPVVSREIIVPKVKGYVSAVHVPVYDSQHKFIGTIGGAIYFQDLAKNYLDKVKFAKTGFASLQDDNGDILYSHNGKNLGKNYFSAAIQNQTGNLKQLNEGILDARNGKTSIVRYVNQQHVAKIAAVVPVSITPTHHWITVVNVPESEVADLLLNTGLNTAFNVVLVILGLSILLITLMMVIYSIRESELQNAKDQFVSLVSHQLRTPLTSTRLFAEMLEDKNVGPLNETQADYVNKISVSTERMIRLVGDILNTSRIELHRLKVEPVDTDLPVFINSLVDDVKPLADQKNVNIKLEMPDGQATKLPLDQTLLGQVIHNLLTNAIRYSNHEKGEVTVRLKAVGSNYKLDVADNGIGIPAKSQKKIFHQFYRAENAIKAEGEGTGIGLYLVKLICDVTGCRISFTSKENQGTSFSVTIPVKGMAAVKGEKSLL